VRVVEVIAVNVLQICEVAKCAVGFVGGFAISQMCCYVVVFFFIFCAVGVFF
jgi:hypothetical protein